ncbi:MAG: response regulator [Patescibacteria group bacterium]|nr:response regulator [Patescibacteria group bacterium]
MTKIQIIEDDHVIRTGLKAMLVDKDYDVDAHDGNDEIINIIISIKLYNPDYIILDLVLPTTDGFQVLSRLKSDDEISNISVIIFSNFSEEDVKERCNRLGANYYFIKNDFSIKDFVEKVDKIIQNNNKIN